LIKYQREKINTQQNDLTKFDAEIVYLESKGREQIQHLEAISQELSKTDQIFRQGNEQVTKLFLKFSFILIVCQFLAPKFALRRRRK
jgi:Ras association domain-containing protein 7/8